MVTAPKIRAGPSQALHPSAGTRQGRDRDARGDSKIPGHQSVFINEPRLSDFKQVLLREGIQAEFVGGVLVCNNLVAVRRTEAGRICLEGLQCEDYYKIRELLYQQYAVV
ncbi:hypothetical protein AALO_G00110880 [Alosa alosa]|uniref:Cleavage and polyadenylation specificity factor subunit 2 n=1 Tax=Alosa alosa TaxID=278164 RepID=A0AAV6GPU9_9TELE|nr:hypothetical protein AALO_G00110880 [Alosa alosa]